MSVPFCVAATPVHAQAGCGAACVLAGPRLASVQTSESELLAPILSGLLGTDVGLSVLDWNALAGAELDLLGLLGAAGQDVTVSDPGQVANLDLTLLELVEAAAVVAEADGDTALVSALDALSLPVAGLSQTINLADLVTIGLPQGALAEIELNALDLVAGAIQLYNYENVLTTPQPVALQSAVLEQYGIRGAEALLQVVEPPHFECGGAGTQFHTAAVRMKLSLDLADVALDTSALDAALGGLLGTAATTSVSLADLDLYLELGRADGQVLSADPDSGAVSLSLAASAADLYLGSIDDAVFFNRARALQPSDLVHGRVGRLDVSLTGGLVQESADISLRALAQSAPPGGETLTFAPPYPQRQTIRSGAASFTELMRSLAQSLDLQVAETLGPLLNPLVDGTIEPLLAETAGGMLVDVLAPVMDQAVDPLLAFLGVGIGEAEATVTAVTSTCADYADCPVSGPAPDGVSTADYGSPSHFIYQSLFMGAAPPDADTGPLPSPDARGDDADGTADEDGVDLPALPAGTTRSIRVTVSESGGSSGYLQGWIDWNGDGRFGDGEQVARDVTLPGGGVITLSVAVPADARPGTSFARFRWSSQAGLGPTGIAPDGEVEDLAVQLGGPPDPVLSGRVFADTGLGGATAHDGAQGGGETGLAQVTVQVETPGGQILALAVTDGDGDFAASLPPGSDGDFVLRAVPPEGWSAVSETVAGPAGLQPSDPDDARLLLRLAAGSEVTGLSLGLVPGPRLLRDTIAYVAAGQVAQLSHDYVAGSAGEVSFSASVPEGAPAGTASVTLFRDDGCDGDPDGVLSGPVTVTAGERLCLVSRVATSGGLADGTSIAYRLEAVTALAGLDRQVLRANADRVVIGRADGGLVIEKSVQNLSLNTGAGRANSARPGDVLLYRIRFANTGPAAVSNVSIHDATPAYTRLDPPFAQVVTVGDGTTCSLVVPETVSAGYSGGLRWDCDGALLPGSAASVEFRVHISQ